MLAALLATAALTAAPCTHAQLSFRLGQSEGAAGHFYTPLVFKNTSGEPCTLRGYPGLSSTNSAHGAQVGKAATRETGHTLATITLKANGGTASSLLTLTDTGVYDKSRCHPKTVKGFRIYAPNQTQAIYHAQQAQHLHDRRLRPVRAAGRRRLKRGLDEHDQDRPHPRDHDGGGDGDEVRESAVVVHAAKGWRRAHPDSIGETPHLSLRLLRKITRQPYPSPVRGMLQGWTPRNSSGSTRSGAPRTTSRSDRSTCSTTRCCASRSHPSTSSRGCSATGAPRPG